MNIYTDASIQIEQEDREISQTEINDIWIEAELDYLDGPWIY